MGERTLGDNCRDIWQHTTLLRTRRHRAGRSDSRRASPFEFQFSLSSLRTCACACVLHIPHKLAVLVAKGMFTLGVWLHSLFFTAVMFLYATSPGTIAVLVAMVILLCWELDAASVLTQQSSLAGLRTYQKK